MVSEAKTKTMSGQRDMRGFGRLAPFMLVTALALVGCGSHSEPGKPNADGLIPIKVAGAEGISTATPLFVAQQQGFFKAAGLDVTYIPMSSGAAAMAAAIKSGEIDVGVGSASQWISDTARGAIKGKLIGEFSDNIYVILGRKGITDPRQLKGKLFAISGHNAGDHLYSQAVLGHYGLKSEDVTWLQLGDPAARLSALLAGKVDATEMSITSLPPAQRERILISADQSPVNFVSNAIYARQPLLDANKGALGKFLAAIGKASDWVRAHPDAAVPACVKSGSSVEACKETIRLSLAAANPYTWSSTTQINAAGIQTMLPMVGAVVPQAKTMVLADVVDTSVAGSH